jgi:cytochrome c-type biogenesis protein CcmH/NrfG
MQRRAAAVSVALFLLLAAGSYTLIGAAQQPAVSLDDPDHAVSEGTEQTIAGTSYTFSSVSEDSATATWVNESAR